MCLALVLLGSHGFKNFHNFQGVGCMICCGVDFGNTWVSSGVRGFLAGDHYKFQPYYRYMPGYDFSGTTDCAKTFTLWGRAGNMELDETFSPTQWFPDCVKINWWQGVMLNAVGLSNPGLAKLMKTGCWQKLTKPFFLSVASVAENDEEQMGEFRLIAEELAGQKKNFRAPFGIQVNLSCPNTGEDPKRMIGKSRQVFEIFKRVGVPVVGKYSIASASIPALMELDADPNCDGICLSNTVPYDYFGLGKKYFGSDISPLAHLGGGGISGPPLVVLVCIVIKALRARGFTKPINGGGGIFCKRDVDQYHFAGTSGISIGSVATLRPWRVKGIIRHANSLQWHKGQAA